MPADDRSRDLYARAVELLPGGVNSPVRAMRSIGRDPIFVAAGEGAELIDVDGNRYVDYVCSWGPLIAGHAHPAVIEAVTTAAARGASFGAPGSWPWRRPPRCSRGCSGRRPSGRCRSGSGTRLTP